MALKSDQYDNFDKAANRLSVIAQPSAEELGITREPIGKSGKRHQITFNRDKLVEWLLDEDRHAPGRPVKEDEG